MKLNAAFVAVAVAGVSISHAAPVPMQPDRLPLPDPISMKLKMRIAMKLHPDASTFTANGGAAHPRLDAGPRKLILVRQGGKPSADERFQTYVEDMDHPITIEELSKKRGYRVSSSHIYQGHAVQIVTKFSKLPEKVQQRELKYLAEMKQKKALDSGKAVQITPLKSEPSNLPENVQQRELKHLAEVKQKAIDSGKAVQIAPLTSEPKDGVKLSDVVDSYRAEGLSASGMEGVRDLTSSLARFWH